MIAYLPGAADSSNSLLVPQVADNVAVRRQAEGRTQEGLAIASSELEVMGAELLVKKTPEAAE